VRVERRDQDALMTRTEILHRAAIGISATAKLVIALVLILTTIALVVGSAIYTYHWLQGEPVEQTK
jgi:hypothetical protein